MELNQFFSQIVIHNMVDQLPSKEAQSIIYYFTHYSTINVDIPTLFTIAVSLPVVKISMEKIIPNYCSYFILLLLFYFCPHDWFHCNDQFSNSMQQFITFHNSVALSATCTLTNRAGLNSYISQSST